jgi:hypothetical protein
MNGVIGFAQQTARDHLCSLVAARFFFPFFGDFSCFMIAILFLENHLKNTRKEQLTFDDVRFSKLTARSRKPP